MYFFLLFIIVRCETVASYCDNMQNTNIENTRSQRTTGRTKSLAADGMVANALRSTLWSESDTNHLRQLKSAKKELCSL